MSTTFTLACSSGDAEATLEITDRLNFPGFNDEWRCIEGAEVFGDPGSGKILDWGRARGERTTLSTGNFTPHLLHGFTNEIQKGEEGTGTKSTLDGTFPSGDFTWVCTKVK